MLPAKNEINQQSTSQRSEPVTDQLFTSQRSEPVTDQLSTSRNSSPVINQLPRCQRSAPEIDQPTPDTDGRSVATTKLHPARDLDGDQKYLANSQL